MRIVNVEDFFHPDAGYQINILAKYLAKFGHDVTIVTAEMEYIPESLTSFFGKDDIERKDLDYTKQTKVNIIRLPLKGFISGRAVFTGELFDVIKRIQPDILFVHGNDTLTGMRILRKNKKLGVPIIFDSHMLDIATRNRLSFAFHLIYRLLYTPIIKRHHYQVIRTQNDPFVEKRLGIPLAQAPWVSYGSDTSLFHPDATVKEKFRTENQIQDDDFVVVYTGKLDEAKGGKLLANVFLKKFNTKRNIVLLVIGGTSGEYGSEVESIFLKSENRIIRFPTQKYCELAKFYQAADLSIFARQCSLSFYDAQACGLPVLSEDNSINVDRCGHGNGWNFISGDVEDCRRVIERITGMSVSDYSLYSRAAYKYIQENYDYEKKVREYEKIMINEIDQQKQVIRNA